MFVVDFLIYYTVFNCDFTICVITVRTFKVVWIKLSAKREYTFIIHHHYIGMRGCIPYEGMCGIHREAKRAFPWILRRKMVIFFNFRAEFLKILS